MGKFDYKDTSRSSTENWKGIVYLAFSKNGIPPSELNVLEWDIYFGILDEFEKENKELEKERRKIENAQTGIISPTSLQGKTEKEKILSMRKPSVRTKRK